MRAALVTTVDPNFNNLAEQTQAYEIIAAEDKRERYLFLAGDVGDVAFSGGMRVASRSIPRKTLYRCMVTPCVTVRKMELVNLIPTGAMIPGSEDRVKKGCGEYWLNAGPEAMQLLQSYGNPGEPERNFGLVELAPDFLRGKDWEKEVKPLGLTKTFFPDWPNLPVLHSDVAAALQERLIDIETTDDPRIASNRAIYVAVGADMLRAVEAARVWSELVCGRTNQAVQQPHGAETHKRGFDALDEICFKRSGMIKNTEALRKVAQQMADNTNNGLNADQLQQILKTVVPQQPAIDAETLAAAITKGVAMAMQMVQQPTPEPKAAPKNGEPKK